MQALYCRFNNWGYRYRLRRIEKEWCTYQLLKTAYWRRHKCRRASHIFTSFIDEKNNLHVRGVNEMPHDTTIKQKMKCIHENTDAIVSYFARALFPFVHLNGVGVGWWYGDGWWWLTHPIVHIFPNTRIIIHILSSSRKKKRISTWIKKQDYQNLMFTESVRYVSIVKATCVQESVYKLHFEIGFNFKILIILLFYYGRQHIYSLLLVFAHKFCLWRVTSLLQSEVALKYYFLNIPDIQSSTMLINAERVFKFWCSL